MLALILFVTIMAIIMVIVDHSHVTWVNGRPVFMMIINGKMICIHDDEPEAKELGFDMPDLSDDEIRCITIQTGCNEPLNKSLRNDEDLTSDRESFVYKLDQVMRGQNTKDMILYRYINHVPDIYLEKKGILRPQYMIDQGYLEASLQRINGHTRKKVLLVITVKADTTCIYLPTYYRCHDTETGVLFPRNTKLYVDKICPSSGRIIVWCHMDKTNVKGGKNQ